MRDILRIGAGVAVGLGLLVLFGSGRDTTPPAPATATVDADDVEAPVPATLVAAEAAAPRAVSSPTAPAAPARPPVRPGWQAGARAPDEVAPSVVVRAASRRPDPRPCPPELAEGPVGAACAAAPARTVEIEWNAPGSTP